VDIKGSKTTIEGDAKVIQVDYSSDESIKHALTGVEVVISTISGKALDVQKKIAAAAKEVDVKLFVPSEFGGNTEGEVEEFFHRVKANIRDQLKALGIPYVGFYTGTFVDLVWASYVLSCFGPFRPVDHRSKGSWASISRVGRCPLVTTATSRLHSRPDQTLRDMFPTSWRTFLLISWITVPSPSLGTTRWCYTALWYCLTNDNPFKQSFNEIFKVYEEKTGKKQQITHIPVSELDARLAANPEDIFAILHKFWATSGPFPRTDNHLYPDWNPSPVIDNVPVA
jgi:hypothetical protein